ncbi:glutamate receptor ionotropic, kainate 2-like [Galendromus occidentalis]|uniref:Glutamate receptor ionotropic, kainate 2-like n=1 Tax=Galendromus occidentalis TaxID=34638 RepID=A0AAJ7SI10_9ACAR|nr:glutamate receptor ionotropic, kainate 2-like [Galendromus occidentalis]
MAESCGAASVASTTFLVLLVSALLLSIAAAYADAKSADTVTIGGVFDQGEDSGLDVHLTQAVERINQDASILRGHQLKALSFKTNPGDSFVASKCVCELVRQAIAALIGPTSWQVQSYVQSASYRMQIPYLQTSPEFRERLSPFTLYLHPSVQQLNRAYHDLIQSRKWKSFAVFYDNDNVFVALKDVLNASLNPPNVLMYPYNPALSFKKMLKDIGSKNIYNIILHLELAKLPQLFREAKEVNQTTLYHDYIVTGLDFHTLDLREFYSLKANVSAFRIIDPDRKEVQVVRRDWALATGLASQNYQSPTASGALRKDKSPNLDRISTTEALLYDAVALVAAGIESLKEKEWKDNNNYNKNPPPLFSQLDCNRSVHWEQGKALLEAIKGARVRGLSGDLRLNRRSGTRDEFALDIVELKHSGLRKTATWTTREGLKFSAANRTEQDAELSKTLEGMTLRVVSVLNEPYTMLYPASENRTGNNRYYGYAIDLIKELAAVCKFNYTFYISPDSKYGSRQPDGKWNGMVGELIQRKADIAVVDLTITYDREQVVDFTIPFMNTGISILFKKPEKSEPAIFSFLYPFSIVVWFYTLTVYTFVSILVYVLGRFTPYEWVPSHPCDPQSEPENQFSSLQNAFWFTMGSIMQQGSDLVPRAISTRVLASIWYFFTLILISSYTANLAAFLTAARMGAPIENANDLAKQTKIAYGCLGGGSTYGFFKKHNDPVMKRMWTYMEAERPTVFTTSNKEGIERVLRGDYAYLMEALSIEYLVERNCNLTQIGTLLDSKGYGIATPLKSPLRSALTSAILILQEKGVLHALKMKWWKQQGGLLKCDEDKGSSSTSEMDMDSVGGVFLTLIVGCAVGVIIVICEFCWKRAKVPYGERGHLFCEFFKEMRHVLACQGSRPNPDSREDLDDEDAAGGTAELSEDIDVAGMALHLNSLKLARTATLQDMRLQNMQGQLQNCKTNQSHIGSDTFSRQTSASHLSRTATLQSRHSNHSVRTSHTMNSVHSMPSVHSNNWGVYEN